MAVWAQELEREQREGRRERTGRNGLKENKSINIAFYLCKSLAGFAKNVNRCWCSL
jgi:hypothetical protein